MYSKIENNEIVEKNISAKQARRNQLNFPPAAKATDDDYRAIGYWPQTGIRPEYSRETQTLSGPKYVIDSDTQTVNLIWTVTDISAEDIAARVQRKTTTAIQDMLDRQAQEYRYDNIHTACGWADKFADALALREWGAACWQIAGQIEQDVIAGNRPLPTPEEVLAEMPEFIAP